MKNINWKNAKNVALGAVVGLGIGVVVTVVYYTKTTYILKEAHWTPQGDMMLEFFHRDGALLIPKD